MTWAEAASLPLCLLTGDMQNRRIVDGIFHEAGAEPRPTLETNSISTLITHVRDGPWSSVMAHAWLHAFDVPRGMRVIPLVAPGDDAHDRPRLARSGPRADPGPGADRPRPRWICRRSSAATRAPGRG